MPSHSATRLQHQCCCNCSHGATLLHAIISVIGNGRLISHAVIRQKADATGPRSYFRFYHKAIMPACTNNKTSSATYNGL